MIKRIIKSYLKEKEDYQKCQKDYKVSGLWTFIENNHFTELIDKIKENDIVGVDNILSNFASSPISLGLALSATILKKEKTWEQLEDDTRKNLIEWNSLTNLPLNAPEYPQKFGFTEIGFEIKLGRENDSITIFTIIPSFKFSYLADRIESLTDDNIIEIGGGFGGVPYHLFKDSNFNKTYLNFDIPEINLIMKYFLMNVFPKKKFLFYGEDTMKNFNKYDIVIMPHYAITEMPNLSCGLAFNSYSLSEMGCEQIKEYLNQIDRISKEYFLHSNHEYQAFFKHSDNALGVNRKELVDLNNPKWELPKNKWKRIYKMKAPFVSSNFYFEFLYQKK